MTTGGEMPSRAASATPFNRRGPKGSSRPSAPGQGAVLDALQPKLGDLHGAIATWKDGSQRFDEESFARRAREAACALLRNGTTAVRTHVDVLVGDDPLRGIRAVDSVRRGLAGLTDIEIVALIKPYSGVELLHAALDCGADLVGGSPHDAPTREQNWTGCSGSPKTAVSELICTPTSSCSANTTPSPVTPRVPVHGRRSASGPRATAPGWAPWPPMNSTSCCRASPTPGSGWGRGQPDHQPVPAGPRRPGRDTAGDHRRARTAPRRCRGGRGADNVRDPFNPLGLKRGPRSHARHHSQTPVRLA
jgi:hypothetical protein